MLNFHLGQTFFIDKEKVGQSPSVVATSIELFFSAKPSATINQSNLTNPGVTIYLCEVGLDKTPDIGSVDKLQARARVEWNEININATTKPSTKFNFEVPALLSTNQMYGFLISFDGKDPDFSLYMNRGEDIVQESSNVDGSLDGYFYKITNGRTLTPDTNSDLAFKLNIARFTSLQETYKIQNQNFDIATLFDYTGSFIGGENIFQERPSETGTVSVSKTSKSVTGSGTSFSSLFRVGDKIVFKGSAFTASPPLVSVREVVSITNNTVMTLDYEPSFTNTAAEFLRTVVGQVHTKLTNRSSLIISKATSNTTLYLQTSQGSYPNVHGEDSNVRAVIKDIHSLPVNSFIPSLGIATPPGTSYELDANFIGTTYSKDETKRVPVTNGQRFFNYASPFFFTSKNVEIHGGNGEKSADLNVTFKTDNPYTSPMLHEEDTRIDIESYEINDLDAYEYSPDQIGYAASRWLSKQTVLQQKAEDLKVYVTAHRPPGTDIKLYARLYNSEDSQTFDKKDWTELALSSPDNFVNPSSISSVTSLEYSLPTLVEDEDGLAKKLTYVDFLYTVTSSCTVITSTGATVNTSIAPGDVVKIYSPYFTDSYFIAKVVSSNTTTFTINKATSNSSVIGSGFKVAKLNRTRSAFIDNQNSNVAVYFNSDNAQFEGFDSFSIKVVFRSSNAFVAPYLYDLRAIAVTA